jgi:hypothetical protein
MTGQTIVNLGVFAKGEIPEPIQITIQDADEVAINLSGYTAEFEIVAVRQTVAGLGAGTTSITDAASGVTKYVWVVADFNTVGTFRGQMWAGDGSTIRLGSFIYQYEVEEITTAPSV